MTGGASRTSGAEAAPQDPEAFPTSAWWPRHLAESAWIEHTPFAAWLVAAMAPRVLVELGTRCGVSYMALCQAARRVSPTPRCFAVGTWQGEEDADADPNAAFEAISALNALRHADVSTLLRMRGAEALDRFEDGSVDLLHIGGDSRAHEAVAEDFRAWLPKMSPCGVVLLHETEGRADGRGAARLWAEVSARWPSFSFLHGQGLGVLAIGEDQAPGIRRVLSAAGDPARRAALRDLFAGRGAAVAAQVHAMAEAPAPRGPDGIRPADAERRPRQEDLLAGAGPGSRIIEIGPSHAPIAPRSAGWSTTVVDHADRQGLVAKYRRDDSVDTSRIEDVDHVWTEGPLDALFPEETHGTYDLLIASHVIEHFPDPVGVLRAAERLLRPDGGLVSLAVPDKRYCFDFFRPPTTTGKLLAAHRDARVRHLAADIFDQNANLAELDGVTGWGFVPSGGARPRRTLREAHRRFLAAREDNAAPYADCHAWVFTPATFELAILELAEIGLIDWRVERLAPQPGVEFIVHLRRGRRVFATEVAFEAHRLALLGDAMRDSHVQTSRFLGLGDGQPQPEPAPPPEPEPPPEPPDPPAAPAPPPADPIRAVLRFVVPLPLRARIARMRGRIR
ncbi:class I SAM-dependent methyltransferase [Roseomonas sp. HF4]|uniref:class I SAM-dependent methyltransferase n=1 Tax=Roseomonas sp. HF4 TaxID=2562313 RepID=UPI001485883C|nr:class I SAM-dependent methyltransferase [Roseomonas sp. HF4]